MSQKWLRELIEEEMDEYQRIMETPTGELSPEDARWSLIAMLEHITGKALPYDSPAIGMIASIAARIAPPPAIEDDAPMTREEWDRLRPILTDMVAKRINDIDIGMLDSFRVLYLTLDVAKAGIVGASIMRMKAPPRGTTVRDTLAL